MEVARQAIEDETEPGVVPVTVMLPPRLATRAFGDLSPGAAVVVTGMLDVDVDRSGKVPLAYHSVIADKIERVADDFIAKHYGRGAEGRALSGGPGRRAEGRALSGGSASNGPPGAGQPPARATGLEPATSGVTGRRSNQLSYAR